jgi:H+-transporting ATPase
MVKVRLGVIVPADLRFVGGYYASIDQAALTGESLPVEKKVGDEAYSGSVVKRGEMQGVVIATGADTFLVARPSSSPVPAPSATRRGRCSKSAIS